MLIPSAPAIRPDHSGRSCEPVIAVPLSASRATNEIVLGVACACADAARVRV